MAVARPSLISQSSSSIKVAPATEKELMVYLGMASQTFCGALDFKMELSKAAVISMRPAFVAIRDLHGGRIPVRRKKFSDEELGKWVESQTFLRASDLCPKLLPDDINKRAEEIKKQLNTQSKK